MLSSDSTQEQRMKTKNTVTIEQFGEKQIIPRNWKGTINKVLWAIQKAKREGWRRTFRDSDGTFDRERLRFPPPHPPREGKVSCFCPVTLLCFLDNGTPFLSADFSEAWRKARLPDVHKEAFFELQTSVTTAADEPLTGWALTQKELLFRRAMLAAWRRT